MSFLFLEVRKAEYLCENNFINISLLLFIVVIIKITYPLRVEFQVFEPLQVGKYVMQKHDGKCLTILKELNKLLHVYNKFHKNRIELILINKKRYQQTLCPNHQCPCSQISSQA